MSDPHRRTGTIMLAIGWLIACGLLYAWFSGWLARERNPNTEAALAKMVFEVRLAPNRDGHYLADGRINGRPVTFLVDTGATDVAVPAALARDLGIQGGAAVRVETANGVAVAYRARLDEVALGPIAVRDVAALITPGMSDDAVLLGMSFLKRFEFSQTAGGLSLRPLPAR